MRDFKWLYGREMMMMKKLKIHFVVLLLLLVTRFWAMHGDGLCLSSATIHFETKQKGNYFQTKVMVHFSLFGPFRSISVHLVLFGPFNLYQLISVNSIHISPSLVHSIHISLIQSISI